MKFGLKLTAALAAGIVLGAFATWATVIYGAAPNALSDGPWQTSLATGSPGATPIRARKWRCTACSRSIAPRRSITPPIADSSGSALDGACTYEIVGHDPDARWWSITAYGADDFLIPNPVDRYSISKNTVLRAADGSFSATVGSAAHVQNWIPTARAPFSLTLRLYDPGASVQSEPESASLPVIVKDRCT